MPKDAKQLTQTFNCHIWQPKLAPNLIAPCGMNCGVCKAYLAYSYGVPEKKGQVTHCAGCIA